jgi:hypothetical protein
MSTLCKFSVVSHSIENKTFTITNGVETHTLSPNSTGFCADGNYYTIDVNYDTGKATVKLCPDDAMSQSVAGPCERQTADRYVKKPDIDACDVHAISRSAVDGCERHLATMDGNKPDIACVDANANISCFVDCNVYANFDAARYAAQCSPFADSKNECVSVVVPGYTVHGVTVPSETFLLSVGMVIYHAGSAYKVFRHMTDPKKGVLVYDGDDQYKARWFPTREKPSPR